MLLPSDTEVGPDCGFETALEDSPAALWEWDLVRPLFKFGGAGTPPRGGDIICASPLGYVENSNQRIFPILQLSIKCTRPAVPARASCPEIPVSCDLSICMPTLLL